MFLPRHRILGIEIESVEPLDPFVEFELWFNNISAEFIQKTHLERQIHGRQDILLVNRYHPFLHTFYK